MNLNSYLGQYNPELVIAVAVVAALILIAIVVAVSKRRSRRRTEDLRARFGPEYDATVAAYGSRRKAEAVLTERLHRVEKIGLHSLTPVERDRYVAEWDSVQNRFVDHPRGAVTEADEMINSVLQACGYPGGKFEQRVSDLSVHHARLAEPYRRANAITIKAGKNEATTEELRSAMILYRALFEELLDTRSNVVRAEAA